LSDGPRFSAPSEAGNVDQSHNAGRGDVETRVQHEKAFAGALGVKWVRLGHNPIEAVFHVRDEVLGSLNAGTMNVNVAKGENGAVRGDETLAGLGEVSARDGGGADESRKTVVVGDELKMPWRVSNREARGGIGNAELNVNVIAHEAATKRENAGEDGEVIGGEPEADERAVVEDGVWQIGSQRGPKSGRWKASGVADGDQKAGGSRWVLDGGRDGVPGASEERAGCSQVKARLKIPKLHDGAAGRRVDFKASKCALGFSGSGDLGEDGALSGLAERRELGILSPGRAGRKVAEAEVGAEQGRLPNRGGSTGRWLRGWCGIGCWLGRLRNAGRGL